ncbi:MAG: tetratricopeptide repeat protein [Muribaculaceae bacterium]|nr:tetratricopeptide repeat protein [Muribaculaceae bacterium]
MNKKLCYSLILGSAVMLTGCGKKLNQFSADYFSVNPSPLEVVGDKVPATVTGKIPGNFFLKNAEVTVTPYLEYNGTEVASQPYTFQGEKVRGNNPVVNYEYGGTVTIPVMYTYVPEMAKSNLSLAFEVKQGSKQYVLPRVKVAEGVVATSTLADAATVTPALAADKFQRIINEKYAADIKFLINQANIRDGELRSAAMKDLNAEIVNASRDSSRQIEEINISSYASPEGGVDLNTRLAENREKNTSKYLQSQLKKDDVTNFGELTAQFTAEDWDGFQKLVSESNIQDKELILSVLSMYKDPEEREREIRNLSSVFEQLADEILPQLRYSRITASINVIGKSDEEIQSLFESNPKALSVDELLYCATLTDDNSKKLAVYAKAAELYPNDYRTFNNLGNCQYVAGDYDAAKASFAKAARLEPSSSESQMNLGLISLMNNDYSDANQKFGSAAGAEGLGDALGVFYLKQGDYANAVKAFGDSKNNNAALAQILTKDYSKAKTTLSSINNPDATTYYLMAVLGARTNNEQMVASNLRQAVKLDSSLAAKAANDLEFSNFNLSGVI